ncbi:MAG: hypothetical protein AB7Q29_01295 [Vicinamibacterales bacterium]
MTFILGLLAFGAALWFLVRLKRQDTQRCREILALEPAPSQTMRGTTPEGFSFSQTAILQGVMLGHAATLWARTVRHPLAAKRRRTGSQFTVLELALTRPARFALRIQPAGLLETLEWASRGPADDRVPIESAFDEAYVVYTSSPADAKAVLTPAVRASLLEFRSRVGGNLPSTTAGRLSSALVLGTFDIEGSNARYALFGSPTAATAEQVKAAAPVLTQLAAAARA